MADINVDRTIPVSIPSPKQERLMGVRFFDWERIRGRVSRISENKPSLSIWYPSMFGISISAALSVWPVSVTRDLPSWVTALYVFAAIGFFVMGVVLWRFDRNLNTNVAQEAKDIVTDMDKLKALHDEYEQAFADTEKASGASNI